MIRTSFSQISSPLDAFNGSLKPKGAWPPGRGHGLSTDFTSDTNRTGHSIYRCQSWFPSIDPTSFRLLICYPLILGSPFFCIKRHGTIS